MRAVADTNVLVRLFVDDDPAQSETANVVVNRPVVQAGLAVLDAGGDFADGIIAFEGSWLGGDTFVTFDKKASKILASQGQATRLLSA